LVKLLRCTRKIAGQYSVPQSDPRMSTRRCDSSAMGDRTPQTRVYGKATDEPYLGQITFQDRSDVVSAGLQMENSEISLKRLFNSPRPQLNLVGTIQNCLVSWRLDSSVADRHRPGWLAAAMARHSVYAVEDQLIQPLRNCVTQAAAARNDLQLRQAQVRRQQVEDWVRLEVADAEENLMKPGLRSALSEVC
jgi:hypothetical protein